MMNLWPFKKKEVKNARPFNVFEYLSSSGYGNVTAWQALRYYEMIAPVAIGIDKIANELKAIQPVIFDKDTQEYSTDNPFLTFLQSPNASISMQDFFKNYGTYYEVTGEVYLMATGNPNRPPLELFVFPPQFVSIEMASDGFPESYNVNNGTTTSTTFTRKEVNGRMRYFNGSDRELWHIKDFNPNASSTNFHGASTLNSVYYEIEQHLSGSRHNLSLLKRGGRLTGAVKVEGVLGDVQFERLKGEIQNNIAGADNAGYVPLFEGGADFVEMGKTNRDMDFATLMQSKAESIYTRLNIPLPLITSSAMTMNNLSVAQLALYDNAVLPLLSKLYGELTLFLGARFGLSEDEILSCDPATIPALQSRRLTNLLMQSKLNVLSDNETRSMMGREGYDGGDSIYKPANLVPVGTDAITDDNRGIPATRQKFLDIMTEQKDVDGARKWSDEEINSFADEEGLL
ncbi:MAG: phage portal protein [Desulfobacteraceae bacterium]|nr:phage portal protein [Desulfobacteraceae bacterium]